MTEKKEGEVSLSFLMLRGLLQVRISPDNKRPSILTHLKDRTDKTASPGARWQGGRPCFLRGCPEDD